MRKDNLEDIAYMIIWQVSLDKNHIVKEVTIHKAMNLTKVSNNDDRIFEAFHPSDLFVDRAKAQISKMDWSDNEPGQMDACAISYLYRSDPDNPVSSNDLSR